MCFGSPRVVDLDSENTWIVQWQGCLIARLSVLADLGVVRKRSWMVERTIIGQERR
jgi:hypothetical protein